MLPPTCSGGRVSSVFPTVVSLNYDSPGTGPSVFNAVKGSWFKVPPRRGVPDSLGISAADLWARCRSDIGFYAHGVCAGRELGDESKLAVGSERQATCDRSPGRWVSGRYVPCSLAREPVAEGRRDPPVSLSDECDEDVLPARGEGQVVYGWSFDERDQHALDAIAANPPKRMAVSVFTGQPGGDQQAFCHQVLKSAGRSLPDTEVTFFDSRSPGCWNNP